MSRIYNSLFGISSIAQRLYCGERVPLCCHSHVAKGHTCRVLSYRSLVHRARHHRSRKRPSHSDSDDDSGRRTERRMTIRRTSGEHRRYFSAACVRCERKREREHFYRISSVKSGGKYRMRDKSQARRSCDGHHVVDRAASRRRNDFTRKVHTLDGEKLLCGLKPR